MEDPRRHRTYVRRVLLATASAVVLMAGFTFYVDPYWIWRESPPWTSQGRGVNRALDTRMRFTKALQIVGRRPELVIIGSSRVQVGIDPVQFEGIEAFNLGIGSLRFLELEAYVRHAIRWGGARTVIFGLDFLTFNDSQPSRPGFDPSLGSVNYLADGITSALLGRTSMRDALRLLRNPVEPDFSYWSSRGFNRIPFRSREAALQLQRFMLARTYTGFGAGDAAYEALDRTLAFAHDRGVDVQLFLSPIHQEQLELIASAGLTPAYEDWKTAMVHLAERHDLDLWDFTVDNPYMRSDLTQGSNRYYLDSSHYSPLLGVIILDRLGYRVRFLPEEASRPFGARLTSTGPPHEPIELRFATP